VILEQPTIERIGDVINAMAPEDRARLGDDAFTLVYSTVAKSWNPWCGVGHGGPFCVGGVVVSPSGIGAPWMIATPGVARNRKFFLRASRAGVAAMQARFPVLRNVVDVRYDKSIRWLTWLGFRVSSPFPMAFGGHEIMVSPFEWRRP
jgi:hypothetical protein